MQCIELNGIVMHYRTRGDSSWPALVFSNSLGTDMRIWDEVAPAFEKDFFTVCYDKRGHGLSTAPPAPYRIDDHYRDLIALMDALELKDTIICGDSVGGLIAQGVAALQPERVKAVVLCDTAAKIGDKPTWNTRIEAVETGGVEALADATLERWFTDDFRANRTAELAGWRNMLVRTPLAGYAGTMMAIRDTDQTEATSNLSIPALVVVGNEDGSTPPHIVKALSELIAGAEFHVISNAGHLPCIDQPGTLVELMRDFFRKNGF